MSRIDIERILGGLLGGTQRSSQRPRVGYGVPRGMNSMLGTILTIGAKAAVDYMTRRQQEVAPAPAPQQRSRDLSPEPPVHGIPQTGSSPWGQTGGETAPSSSVSADHAEAILILRVAIAAAKADGTLDAAERAHISAQLDAAGLAENERDFVLNDLQNPITIEEIGRQVRDPMLAAQVYAAAFATIDQVDAAERDWLNRLAAKLRLDAQATAAIEARLGTAS